MRGAQKCVTPPELFVPGDKDEFLVGKGVSEPGRPPELVVTATVRMVIFPKPGRDAAINIFALPWKKSKNFSLRLMKSNLKLNYGSIHSLLENLRGMLSEDTEVICDIIFYLGFFTVKLRLRFYF